MTNTEIVQKGYENFASGDIDGLLSLFADDISWTVPDIENAPFAGSRTGTDAVRQFFSQLTEAENITRFEPLEFIAEGDKVVVSYYEAIAAEVKKPGEGVQGVEADVSTVQAEPGQMPAAGAGVLLRSTVKIDSVDTQFNTVTFYNSAGQLRTLAVQSPEGQKFIKGLKKGDEVEVAYTEAMAIEVKPAG